MKTSKISLLSISIALASGAGISQAKHLSPEEALSAYIGHQRQYAPAFETVSQYSYAYGATDSATGIDNVYVYTRDGMPGFIVLAADDKVGNLLLGYSDATAFSADNMPPALRYMLSAYSQIIGSASTDISRAQKDTFADISPICTTKWDQLSPYNDLCPTIDGYVAPTGCVATAMAQVMNVHKWPSRGVGSISYSYVYGRSYRTMSHNFENDVFDWDSMADDYSYGYTTEKQRNAVATLMAACGYASQMQYWPESSGAYDINAAIGLVNYMNYDKGIRYVMASWFDPEEWEQLLYDELQADRPFMLSGVDVDMNGHEFVCDGFGKFSGENYFHINWGWGGVSDGYFSLFCLNPFSQGVGGGSGNGGFDYGVGAIIGIQPPLENSSFVPMMEIEDEFSTDYNYYKIDTYNIINFTGGFYSVSTGPIRVKLGLKITYSALPDDVDYLLYEESELRPNYGLRYISLYVSDLPKGSYNVSPGFFDQNDEWHEMYYDKSGKAPLLRLDVTDQDVTVTDGVPMEPQAIELIDGTPYDNTRLIENVDLTYIRNFRNTNWQPLYVPFSMDYSDWAPYADVAELAGVHMYDDDNDGITDRTSIEFLTVREGSIKPNTPYVIRAKVAGEVSFSLSGKDLLPSPAIPGEVSSSSPRWIYSMKGTYEQLSDLDYDNIYVLGSGKFSHTQGTLNPYRFYLEVNKKSGGYWEAPAKNPFPEIIELMVDGETCGIESLLDDSLQIMNGDNCYYDLSGRKVINPESGIYLHKGKLIYIK